MTNSMIHLKDFLSTPEKPVSSEEVMEFWKSLSDVEKEYYRNAELEE